MEHKKVLTRKSYDAKIEELNHLKTVGRDEVAEKIKEARSFGDLSENAEYDEAMNDQAKLEARIAALILETTDIEIIESDYLNKVVVENTETNEVKEYIILTSSEAKPSHGIISDISPVGAALLNSKKGDIVDILLPSGSSIKYKVLESEKK